MKNVTFQYRHILDFDQIYCQNGVSTPSLAYKLI